MVGVHDVFGVVEVEGVVGDLAIPEEMIVCQCDFVGVDTGVQDAGDRMAV